MKRLQVSALNGDNYVHHTLWGPNSGGGDVCGTYPVACVLRWGKASNKEAAVTLEQKQSCQQGNRGKK